MMFEISCIILFPKKSANLAVYFLNVYWLNLCYVIHSSSSGPLEEKSNFVAYMDENTPNLISVPGLSIFVQDKDQVNYVIAP